jgi:hypothetical protein
MKSNRGKGPGVTLQWERHSDFFDLYKRYKDERYLIYIIGEFHHVYIGSVGSRGGASGLAARYLSQYIKRSIAIFGSDCPRNQPAFSGRFCKPKKPSPSIVQRTERYIQKLFRDTYPKGNLFRAPCNVDSMNVVSIGNRCPKFLKLRRV